MGLVRSCGLALILGAALVTLPASPAQAVSAAECDVLVYAQAGALVDSAALQDAVGAATRAGALVRIRSYPTVPAGDLDAHIDGLQAECPSWRAPDGSRRSNLLVLAVSTGDRTTGMYYGSAYEGALDGEWNRIQADLMNPRFRDGDFALGLADGLVEATSLIQQWQHPRAAPASTDGSASVLPVVVGVLLTLAALAALAIGTVVALRHRRRRRGEAASLATARARAQSAFEEASAAFVAVDTSAQDASAASAAVMALVSDDDDKDLSTALAEAQAAVDAASQSWIAAQERWGTGALARADVDQAKAARATLVAIARDLSEADELVAAAGARALELTATADALPARLQQAREQVVRATADLAAATAAGLDVTTGSRSVAGAAADLDQAAAMIESHRIRAAEALITQVRERAETLSRDCAELPARLELAGAALSDAAEAATGRRAARPAAVAVLAELTAAYGPASLADIDGPVSDIAVRLDAADSAITEGRAALAERSLDGLERIAACLAAVTAALTDVDNARAALDARSSELPALAAELPARLADLDSAIERARAFNAEHADDVDPSRTSDLDAAQSEVQALAAILGTTRSDLPSVSEQADRIAAAIATAATAAATDVRTAEDGRRRAGAALAKAKAALDASEAALNRYGRGSGAGSALKAARSSYAGAQAATDLALVVSLATKASAQAEQAAQTARRAHEQAGVQTEQADRDGRESRDARADREQSDRGGDGGGGSSSFGSDGGGGGSTTW